LQEDSATCIELCSEAEDLLDEAMSLREQNRRSLNNLLFLAENASGNQRSQKSDDYIVQARVFIPSNAFYLQPIEIDQSLLDHGMVTQTFVWEFENSSWVWELDVPIMLHNYYKSLPRNMVDYSTYISNPFDETYIDGIVTEIERVAKTQDFNKRETVEFAAAFVQSTPYTLDKDTTDFSDYPRYPIETLAEKSGDCEDTAILLVSIMKRMEIETTLIHFVRTAKTAGHYGVGISGLTDVYGKHWSHNGLEYYYMETIEIGSKIGDIPDEWANIKPEIIGLKSIPFITCNWNIDNLETMSTIEITVNNLGTSTASDIYIDIYLYSCYDEYAASDILRIVDSMKQGSPFDLPAGESVTMNMILPLSLDNVYEPFVYVMQDGLIINHNIPN